MILQIRGSFKKDTEGGLGDGAFMPLLSQKGFPMFCRTISKIIICLDWVAPTGHQPVLVLTIGSVGFEASHFT